jgi:hypothetical protein
MIFIDNIPYTYLIGWTKLNVWYYGRRTAKDCHPDEFWVTYFTSSIEVDKFRALHGDPDVKQIRQIFTDIDYTARITKCVNWEASVIDKIGAVKSKHWLNGHGSKFDTTGTLWWNNGVTNKCAVESPGPEWHLGMIVVPLSWWNNGIEETKAIGCPGNEWQKGRLLGKSIWNNGVTECRSFHKPGTLWTRGRLSTPGLERSKEVLTKLWWNNGIINKKSNIKPGDKWVRGMLPKFK